MHPLEAEDTRALLRKSAMDTEETGQLRVRDGSYVRLQYLPCEYKSIHHYRPSLLRSVLYYLLAIGSFGIVPIVAHWLPWVYAGLKLMPASTSSDFQGTDYVLLEASESTGWELVRLHVERNGIVYFEYRKNRYLYDKELREFHRLSASVAEMTLKEAQLRLTEGYNEAMVTILGDVFGPNVIDLGVLPVHIVLFHKILHPFYIFQIVSVGLWIIEQYYTYALLILVMSVVSVAYEVASQVVNMNKLQAIVQNDSVVQVVRDNEILAIPVASVVVGDIVLINTGLLAADMVLLQGDCTVDESSLTGEGKVHFSIEINRMTAIPVQKECLSDDSFCINAGLGLKKKEAALYSGSTVLRHSPNARGMVLSIGFSTSKGELFRSIVCPKPMQFKVEQDTYRFLAGLTIVAVIAGIKNAFNAAQHGVVWWRIIVYSLDLITIAVPPALPLILTVGVGFAMTRLQEKRVFCIDSPRINLAGHLDCFCFDKTGTLTSDHMVFDGVDSFQSHSTDNDSVNSIQSLESSPSLLRQGVGLCHTVTLHDNELIGSPLECEMLQHSGYRLLSSTEIKCVDTDTTFTRKQRYAFDPSIQLSSVLVHNHSNNTRFVFAKGSPEAIANVCNASSLPTNFRTKVHRYSRDGYYCMALAYKPFEQSIDSKSVLRQEMESNLTFLGLLLFENPIKRESFMVIDTLQRANIDVRMITGDNVFTAIHVSRKLRIFNGPIHFIDVSEDDGAIIADLDQTISEPFCIDKLLPMHDYAITGSALKKLKNSFNPHLLQQLVKKVKIFARIRPDQKTWIVEQLIDSGKHVGMCGDGTNDCGALKAAHVGLALSNAEASIVAPFTSCDKSIVDVVALIKEGRCALMTSFLAFKFMVMYPIIQVVISSTLYASMITMGNNQFLFDDMIVVLGLSMLMLKTEPSKVLTHHKPPNTLFDGSILYSLAGHVLIYLVCFCSVLYALRMQSWYCSLSDAKATLNHTMKYGCFKYEPPGNDGYTRISYENTILWLFGHWEFVLVAIAFNIKDPFRQSVWTNNRTFVAYTVAMFVALLFLTLSNNSYVLQLFELVDFPQEFRWSILGVVLINGICNILWEMAILRSNTTAASTNELAVMSNNMIV